MLTMSFDLATLRARYVNRTLTPMEVVEQIIERTASDPHTVWIHRLSDATLRAYATALSTQDPSTLPLYGIPFAIKDNIDLANVPTTAACPAFAYTPTQHAFVVQQLIDAGAIPIGKTNLDQFATGLNGTRSPYGPCRNAFDPDYVSGGSSSGSAVAVALGYCSFALGTDTAGSGRVPAMLNNLVGLKPTLGLLSATGVVPACRTLDTISLLCLTAADAADVLGVVARTDAQDVYSRAFPATTPLTFSDGGFRFGVPASAYLDYFGNDAGPARFAAAIAALEALGGTAVEIDFAPFMETARLLYDGPWVAERYAAIADFIESQPDAILPVTSQIINNAKRFDAVATFKAQYRLQALKREAAATWQSCDVIVMPSAGGHHTIAAMQADPIRLNTELGYYTNFVNLMDLSAIAVPAGMQADGLPFGVTLCAPAFADYQLVALAAGLQRQLSATLGATQHALRDCDRDPTYVHPARTIDIAVCGAHMRGLPLNHQLSSAGARFVMATKTQATYRFIALPGGPPHRPGLMRVVSGGAAIEVEVWRMPLLAYGAFVAGIPAPLGIGTVALDDGSTVQGFVCESAASNGALDITHLGSWKAYLATIA